jgi:hypothetical protein
VALRNVVTSESSRGPILIDRKDQQRRVTVTANYSGRDLGSVAADVQGRLDQIPRPVGYDLMVAGNFEEQHQGLPRAGGHRSYWRWSWCTWCWPASMNRCGIRWWSCFPFPWRHRRAGDLVCDENHIERAVLHRLHHAGRHRGQQCDICWWIRPAD